MDLTGWYVLDDRDDHLPCMLAGLFAPGEALVVAGRPDVCWVQYPGVTNVNPNYYDDWGLADGGDAVRIVNASDGVVDQVWYDDSASSSLRSLRDWMWGTLL